MYDKNDSSKGRRRRTETDQQNGSASENEAEDRSDAVGPQGPSERILSLLRRGGLREFVALFSLGLANLAFEQVKRDGYSRKPSRKRWPRIAALQEIVLRVFPDATWIRVWPVLSWHYPTPNGSEFCAVDALLLLAFSSYGPWKDDYVAQIFGIRRILGVRFSGSYLDRALVDRQSRVVVPLEAADEVARELRELRIPRTDEFGRPGLRPGCLAILRGQCGVLERADGEHDPKPRKVFQRFVRDASDSSYMMKDFEREWKLESLAERIFVEALAIAQLLGHMVRADAEWKRDMHYDVAKRFCDRKAKELGVTPEFVEAVRHGGDGAYEAVASWVGHDGHEPSARANNLKIGVARAKAALGLGIRDIPQLGRGTAPVE